MRELRCLCCGKIINTENASKSELENQWHQKCCNSFFGKGAFPNQKSNNIQIELFIKKDDNEGTDFYYIGKMKTDYESKEQTQIPNEKGQMLPVVNLQFDIEPSVPQNLYSYLEA